MAEFNESDYFPIITAVIRAGSVVPFDCFLLLRANQRVILFAPAHQEFPEVKLDKLKKFKFDQLHVRQEDRPAYFKYLEQFLGSEDGKKAIQEIGSDLRNSAAFSELPDHLKSSINTIQSTESSVEPHDESVTELPVSESNNEPTDQESEMAGTDPPAESEEVIENPPESEQSSETVEDASPEQEDLEETRVASVTEQLTEESETVPDSLEAAEDVVVSGETENQDEIVNVLHQHADEVEEILNFRTEASPDELERIRSVTQKIEEEIETVKGAPQDEEGLSTIKNTTDRLSEEINRISGMIDDDEKGKFKVISPQVKKIKAKLDELAKISGNPEGESEPWKKISAVTDTISDQNQEIDDVIIPNKKQLVEKKLSRIVSGLGKVFDEKLAIEGDEISESLYKLIQKIYNACLVYKKTLESKRDIDPQLKKNFFVILTSVNKLYHIVTTEKTLVKGEPANYDDSDEAEDSSEQDAKSTISPELAQRLKNITERQNSIIAELKFRLKRATNHFQEIMEGWNQFQTNTKDRLSPGDKLKAQQFAVNLNELESHYIGMKNQSENLIGTSEDLSPLVQTETAKQLIEKQNSGEGSNSSKTDQAAPTETDSDSVAGPEQTKPDVNPLESLEIPPPIAEDATIDEYKTENRVLRLQLENAKSLIDAGNRKISQLTKLIDETGGYTEALEKETNDRKGETQKQIDKVEKTEEENRKIREGLNDLDRLLKKTKGHLAAREEALQDKQDELDATKRELQNWKARALKVEASLPKTDPRDKEKAIPPEILSEIKQKDDYIKKISHKLEVKNSQYKEMYKDNFKLKSQVAGMNQLKKTMSEKVERMQAEKENFRQSQDATARKTQIIQGLLDKARKTVTKITEANDQLRQERVEYMNKTNEAMQGYKDMINKANSLSNHVQAEIQRNQSLGDQFETMKRKYQESMAKTNELQRTVRKLEAEKKQLKKDITDAKNLAQSAGIHQQARELQNTVASLERENKTLRNQVSEQGALTQKYQAQLKTLQSQLRKKGAA